MITLVVLCAGSLKRIGPKSHGRHSVGPVLCLVVLVSLTVLAPRLFVFWG